MHGHIRVVYFDEQERYYPIGPDQPWKRDPVAKELIIGASCIPRTHIPLSNVRSYHVEPCEEHGEHDAPVVDITPDSLLRAVN